MKTVIVGMSPGRKFSLAPYLLKAYCNKFADLREKLQIVIKGFVGKVKDEQIFGNVFTKHPYNTDEIVEEILAEKADAIAFSCYIWNINDILKACRILKRRTPDSVIILGGPQVTPCSAYVLRKNPAIDVIVRGEGEVTFSELLRYYTFGNSGLGQIDGIAYRDGSVIRENRLRKPIENLDEIPSPYLTGEVNLNEIGNTLGAYETYRGCVMGCKFCNWGKNKEIRYYSLERIEKEITLIGKSQLKRVWFADSIANLDKERFKRILRFIINNNPANVTFDFEMMAELLDEETIDLIGQANIGYIAFGLQTSNKAALITAGRIWNKERFEDNIKLLKARTSVDFYIDLIYGLPGDNWETYRETIRYCGTLFPRRIQHHSLQVLPGSEFFENSSKYGIKFSPRPPYWVHSSNTFNVHDMKMARKWLGYLELYYFKPVNKIIHILSVKMDLNPIDLLEEYVKRLKGKVSLHKINSPVKRAETGTNRIITNLLVKATSDIVEHTGNIKLIKCAQFLADVVRFECHRFIFDTSCEGLKYLPKRGRGFSLDDRPVLLPGVIVEGFSYNVSRFADIHEILREIELGPVPENTYYAFNSWDTSRINSAAYEILCRCNGQRTVRDIIEECAETMGLDSTRIQVESLMAFNTFVKKRFLGLLTGQESSELEENLGKLARRS